MTRLAIHHLRQGGLSQASIAASVTRQEPDAPVSVRSVRRILAEAPPSVAALAGAAPPSGPGRPSVAKAFRESIATALEEESHLSTAELLRRARDLWDYTGQKTAFYELVRTVRKPSGLGAEPIVRFEGVPGEYAQFDFGERRIRYANGYSRKVIVFVGRLKFSRHIHVEIVPDQKAETLVRAVVACLHTWGIVPLIWVFDNPKTVRTSKVGEPVVLHPYLAGLAAELNAAVMLCTPHQPQQKGSVENGVKWVKNAFLAQRCFVDDADLADQLRGWLADVNTRRASDATGEIPQERLHREQARLGERRMPFTPAEYALRIPVTVLPTGMIHLCGTSYSVDPRKVGAPAVARLTAHTVTVVIDGIACSHPRCDHCDQPQRLPEHRQAMLGAIHGKRKHNTYKRQCLFEIGPGARDFLEGLVHRHGPHGGWCRPVHQLFTLLEEHGDHALERAMTACHAQRRYDVPSVVAALQPRLRAQEVRS